MFSSMEAQTALVTGCGSPTGIGFACAERLSRVCGTVVITSTTSDRIEARAAELRDGGCSAQIKCFAADLTVEQDVEALSKFAGDVDILVNNAGMVQTGVDDGPSAVLAETTLPACELFSCAVLTRS